MNQYSLCRSFVLLSILLLTRASFGQAILDDSIAVKYQELRQEISQKYGLENIDAALLEAKDLLAKGQEELGEDHLVHALNLKYIGSLYTNKGDRVNALFWYKKALSKAEILLDKNDPLLGELSFTISAHCLGVGQYSEGYSYLQHAEQIYVHNYGAKDPKLFPIYGQLAYILTIAGEVEEGYKYALAQLEMAQKHFKKGSYERAKCHSVMANFWYTSKRKFKKNLEEKYRREALAIEAQFKVVQGFIDFKGPDDPSTGNAWFNLGVYHKDSGKNDKERSEKAKRYLLEGARIYEKTYNGLHPALSVAYRNLSGLYKRHGFDDEENVRQLFFFRNKSISAVLPNFKPHPDSIFAVPDFSQPEQLICLDMEKVYRGINNKASNVKSYYAFKKDPTLIFKGLDLVSAGALFLEKKLQTISQKEDESILLNYLSNFYSEQIYYYNLLYKKTKDKSYLNKSFEVAEKSKSIVLLRNLKADGIKDAELIPREATQQGKSLKKRIAFFQNLLLQAEKEVDAAKKETLQDSLFHANKAYDSYMSELKAKYPKYFNLQYNHEVRTVREIQENLLDESTMLLEIHAAPRSKNVTLYSITKRAIQTYVISSKEQEDFKKNIKDELKPFNDYSALKGKDKQGKAFLEVVELSYKLYKDILHLDEVLTDPKIKRLIVVADGVYSYIPFELLIQSKPQGDDGFKDLDYLIKDYTISYAYSASVLVQNLENKRNVRKHHKVLGYAAHYDPKLDTNSNRPTALKALREILNPLPGVENEVKALQEAFEGDFFFDEAASERNFKATDFESYAIVHLAMHGLLNQDDAMASSMAFSEDMDSLEDNFLHAYELMNMEIHADLVVLSACETGLGKLSNGEGVMSLARTFAYAGAPSLIMTLWPVNDQSTALIMKQFYQQLKEGLPKDEALRQAKLEYLGHANKLTSHPVFWGPYILVGDTNPVELHQSNSWWMYGGMGLLGILLMGGLWKRKA